MAKRTDTYTVRGMSCAGCEGIIEDALKQLGGVSAVRADFSGNTVTVTYDDSVIKPRKFADTVKKAGYTMELESQGTSQDNGKPMTLYQFLGLAAVLVGVYFLIAKTVGFNFIPEISASMGYGILFVVGLLTSLHCVAMCGGIAMSQCLSAGQTAGVKDKLRPSLLYNAGRVVSYTVLGGIIGALGSVISFSGWARGIIAVISGLFMIIMGISMTGLFPWLHKITPRLPRIFRQKAAGAGKNKGPFVVGLLNGLMPCGPLQAMQLYALGTGSFLAGALSMLVFSLGTLPLMFGLGAFITMMGSKFTKRMIAVGAVLVAVLGVVMLTRGLALSGVNLPGASPETAVTETAAPDSTVQDGVQRITTTMTSTTSYPTITVEKGVPVVWTFTADKSLLNGCNNKLVLPDYNVQASLKPGETIIEFTPTESGTQTYTCWMGMVNGTIIVTDSTESKDTGGTAQSSAAVSPSASATGPAASGSCCLTGSSTKNGYGPTSNTLPQTGSCCGSSVTSAA